MHDARESGNPTQRPADAFANLREQYGAYFDAIPDVDAFVREQRRGEMVSGELCVGKLEIDGIVAGGSSSTASLCIDSHLEEFLRQNPLRVAQVTEANYKLTPWPKTVDDRLDALEAEVKALRELMRRLEDGK